MATKRITEVNHTELLNDNDSLFINQNDSLKQIKKSDILFGISNGGTGANNLEGIKKNLEIPTIVKLTQAEYDGLPDSKNSNGVLYIVD